MDIKAKKLQLFSIFFLTLRFTAFSQVAEPTKETIESSISSAISKGRIVSISASSMGIPAMLKEIASLPVVFRTTQSSINYDIVVMQMNIKKDGSELAVGAKISPSNSNSSLYFGSKSVAVSAKHGFSGSMPILQSTLTACEIDDPQSILRGNNKFTELALENFRGNGTLGLGPQSALFFECGEFIKLNLSGYLKISNLVKRENPDGTTIPDAKPLMLFFQDQEVSDWDDMYMQAIVSRGFHADKFEDIGFQFPSNSRVFVDLSSKQNPKDLPSCAVSAGNGWQGVAFETFEARLPNTFLLKNPRILNTAATNLFLEPNGLLGNVSINNVFDISEGYTDETNKFDMSLDKLTASYGCGGSRNLTMAGTIKLGLCNGATGNAPLIKYRIAQNGISPNYTVLIRENENQNFISGGYQLSTGSTLNMAFDGQFHFRTKLSAKPTLVSNAYANSICKTFPALLTASNCGSNTIKWSTGDEGKTELQVLPETNTVYSINCSDKFCVNETSEPLSITVFEGLPNLSLVPNDNNICNISSTNIVKSGTCPGIVQWITPEKNVYSDDAATFKRVYFPNINTDFEAIYNVRCKLNECFSNATASAQKTVNIRKMPNSPRLSTNLPNNRVQSGNSITISGGCNSNETFQWIEGTTATGQSFDYATSVNYNNTYTHTFKGRCSNTYCSIDQEISIVEYPAEAPPPPTPDPTSCNTPPPPILTASQTVISPSESVILIGSCTTGSLIWTGPTNFNGGQHSPSATTIYAAKCSLYAGCESAISSITVSINDCINVPLKPSISISATEIASGGSVNISASSCNAGSLSWSSSPVGILNSGAHTLSRTTDIYVRCQLSPSCVSETDVKRVNVCSIPSKPSISISDNENGTITVSGSCTDGASITWSTNSGTLTKPTIATTYKAKCTKPVCESEEASVGFDPRCTIFAEIKNLTYSFVNNDFCKESLLSLKAETSLNIMSVHWSTNGTGVWFNRNTKNPQYSPSEEDRKKGLVKIQVSSLDLDGSGPCQSVSKEIEIKLYEATPPPNISVSNDKLCFGETIIATSSNCSGIVEWSNGNVGNSITILTSNSIDLSATCLFGSCKSDISNVISISLNKPLPVIIKYENETRKCNEKAILTASGCKDGTVIWSDGQFGSEIKVSPSIETTYTAYCREGKCRSEESNKILINNCKK